MKKLLLLSLLFVVLPCMFSCDGDGEDNPRDIEGSSWTFTITTGGTTFSGTFSISTQNGEALAGFGTLEIGYIDAEFNMNGDIDKDDNISMFFNLLDPQWVDITVYSCKCKANTMDGLARSNNWNNATFHATRK